MELCPERYCNLVGHRLATADGGCFLEVVSMNVSLKVMLFFHSGFSHSLKPHFSQSFCIGVFSKAVSVTIPFFIIVVMEISEFRPFS